MVIRVKKTLYKIIRSNAFYITAAVVSLALPVYIYSSIFIQQIKDPNPYYTYAFYPETVLFAVFFSAFCIGIFSKISHCKKKLLLCALIYLLLFTYSAFQVAYDNRVEFGNTWNHIEVLRELVLQNTYYYVLLTAGLVLNLLLHTFYIKIKKAS